MAYGAYAPTTLVIMSPPGCQPKLRLSFSNRVVPDGSQGKDTEHESEESASPAIKGQARPSADQGADQQVFKFQGRHRRIRLRENRP